MSSCCLTIADLLSAALDSAVETIGITATYYPAIITGYDETGTVRTPSEATAVSVTGIFANLRQTHPDDVLTRNATFTFPYSSGLSFTPSAMDRLVISGYSYRATELAIEQIGSTVSSYTLTVVQA